MSAVLNDFIELLVGGIQEMAQGIGSGLNSAFTEMFLTTSEQGTITGLSTFGGVVAVMAGIALAIGLTRLVFMFITNLGK